MTTRHTRSRRTRGAARGSRSAAPAGAPGAGTAGRGLGGPTRCTGEPASPRRQGSRGGPGRLEERLPDAPRIEAEHLGRLQTLRSIVEHLSSGTTHVQERHTSEPAPGRVESVLLSVVSAKTGYPADMLELDMALDADLGIDSIKRVEILSALEEELPDAPRIEAEHLGGLQPLRSISEYLSTSHARPSVPAAIAEPEPEPVTAPARLHRSAVTPIAVATDTSRHLALPHDREILVTGDSMLSHSIVSTPGYDLCH